MPSFDELQKAADNRGLIRKIQRAVGFVGTKDLELPKTLFSAAGEYIDLIALGWAPVGIVSTDGWNFGREPESEEVEGLGYASAVRTDIVKVSRSVTITTLETGRKRMQEVLLGTDLDGITQDPITGEIVIDEPDMPISEELRLLVIGKDGPKDNEWVMGKGFGVATLDTNGEEVWGKEGAVQRELTFKIAPDDVTGSPTRHYLGGTGALKAADALGYNAGS